MDLSNSNIITVWLRQTLIPDCEMPGKDNNSAENSTQISLSNNLSLSVIHFGSSLLNETTTSPNYYYASSINADYELESSTTEPTEIMMEWIPTYSNDLQVFTILFAYTVSFMLSFGGNCLAIIIFVRYDNWPADLRLLLTNISVAGLLSAVLCLPFTLLYQLLQSWVFTGPLCRIITFLQLGATIGTILTHLAIGLNRLWVIVYPLKASTFQEYVWRIVAVIWAIAAAISAPNLITTDTRNRRVTDDGCYSGKQYLMCEEQWPQEYSAAYTWALMICMYFLPMVVLLCIYGMSGYVLSKSQHDMKFNEETIAKRLHNKQKILRMLMIIFALFGISWLPLHTFFIFQAFHEDIIMTNFEKAERVYWIIHWLATSNSFQNPIVYCFFDEKFKMSVLHLFGRRKGHQRPGTIGSNGRSFYPSSASGTYQKSSAVNNSYHNNRSATTKVQTPTKTAGSIVAGQNNKQGSPTSSRLPLYEKKGDSKKALLSEQDGILPFIKLGGIESDEGFPIPTNGSVVKELLDHETCDTPESPQPTNEILQKDEDEDENKIRCQLVLDDPSQAEPLLSAPTNGGASVSSPTVSMLSAGTGGTNSSMSGPGDGTSNSFFVLYEYSSI